MINPNTNRRRFLQTGLGLAAAASLPAVARAAANDELRVAILGAGGRGGEMARAFANVSGVRIVAVADPDSQRAEKMANQYQATATTDLRRVLEDANVDAVVVTTCNHWHCLASIWALQAGKHVYVEKPLSHTQWEGRQVVAAAEKSGLVCTIGTQQRSDPMQAEIKSFLHSDKTLGAIQYVQANRLGARAAIGRRTQPLEVPQAVAYDLWLGPAANQPIYRNQLHYDWHWDFNTGNGEMGNWGVHILDDIRNTVYQDSVAMPKRVVAAGGRVAWEDAGQTPNVHYALLETETFPTVVSLSNLPPAPGVKGSWKSPIHPQIGHPGSGYVVVCEGGYFCGQRGRATAYDRDGKQIRSFKGGNIVPLHAANFVAAVRDNDASRLNVSIETGHYSSGWCNLINIAFQVGASYDREALLAAGDLPAWERLVQQMEQQLQPFGVSPDQLRSSPVLTHDAKTERFIGPLADQANQYLRRAYRSGYEVPELV